MPRDAIAEALWWAVSASALPAACVALGLCEGDSVEAMNSKRKCVRSRITTFKGQDLLTLAHRVVEAYGAADLTDYVSELTTHADHRITDLIRRAVLAELVSAGELLGDLQRAGYLPCADYASDTRGVTTAASIRN